jgi:predicted transcriptional regulator
LDKALARIRELPEEDQDALAIALLAMAEVEHPLADLDEETRTAIREGIAQARQGEFVADEEIEALWTRYGL